MKGEYKMFLRFVLLGIAFIVILFIFEFLIPKVKLKIRLQRELKIKKQREETFRKKMKELEIK